MTSKKITILYLLLSISLYGCGHTKYRNIHPERNNQATFNNDIIYCDKIAQMNLQQTQQSTGYFTSSTITGYDQYGNTYSGFSTTYHINPAEQINSGFQQASNSINILIKKEECLRNRGWYEVNDDTSHSQINSSYEKLFEKVINSGTVDEQCALGKYFFNGKGAKKNYSYAEELFEKAAKSGSAEAKYWLGHMAQYGYSMPRDSTRACILYKEAAEQGNINALRALGKIYYFGDEIIQKNYYISFKWFQKAALQNDGISQYYLGIMYQNGQGVYKNSQIAKDWFEKAKKNGITNQT